MSGKFKICLISENKEVSEIVEGSKDEKLVIDIEKGKYYISIVGLEAKGQLDLTFFDNDIISVYNVDD